MNKTTKNCEKRCEVLKTNSLMCLSSTDELHTLISENGVKTDNINWSKESWNPVTGCSEISSGCQRCYAKRMAERFRGTKAFPYGFDFQLHPDRLTIPYHWRKSRNVFVNSMSDLFYESVPDDFIAAVLKVIADTPQHTYRILTKRPERMQKWFSEVYRQSCPNNVWLGVTVEDALYTGRIDLLKQIDAKTKFICFEPLLGDVRVTNDTLASINWVIVGGETGTEARQMKKEWIEPIYKACRELGIPFFFKHWGVCNETGHRIRAKNNRYDGQVIQEYPV
ncbi:MAG: DUF5131 family protein [Ruminiclostridium sp.]